MSWREYYGPIKNHVISSVGRVKVIDLVTESGMVRPRSDQVIQKILGTFSHQFIKHLRELTDTFILLGIPNKEKYLIFMLYPHEIPNIHALVNTDGQTDERTDGQVETSIPPYNFVVRGV